jgi:hypothetical protein
MGVAKQARIKARANGHDMAHSTLSTHTDDKDRPYVVHTMTCLKCGMSAVARKNHQPEGSAIREHCKEVIDETID